MVSPVVPGKKIVLLFVLRFHVFLFLHWLLWSFDLYWYGSCFNKRFRPFLSFSVEYRWPFCVQWILFHYCVYSVLFLFSFMVRLMYRRQVFALIISTCGFSGSQCTIYVVGISILEMYRYQYIHNLCLAFGVSYFCDRETKILTNRLELARTFGWYGFQIAIRMSFLSVDGVI